MAPHYEVKRNVVLRNTLIPTLGCNAPMADHQDLAGMVRAARKAAGLTQADAAAGIGIERATLAKIETGTMPGRTTLMALSKFYGIPMDTLASRALSSAFPEGREFAKDGNEIALLRFWRSLDDDQRSHFLWLLGAPIEALAERDTKIARVKNRP